MQAFLKFCGAYFKLVMPKPHFLSSFFCLHVDVYHPKPKKASRKKSQSKGKQPKQPQKKPKSPQKKKKRSEGNYSSPYKLHTKCMSLLGLKYIGW